MTQNPTNTEGQPEDISSLFTKEGLKTALKDIAISNSNVLKGMAEIDVEAMKVSKSFGVGRDNIVNLKQVVVEARDGVIAMGGTWKNIYENQIAAADALGRNVIISADAQKELFAASTVSGQKVGDIVKAFKDVGVSALQAGDQMGKVVSAANEAGVGAQRVSKMVVENMGTLNKFNFEGGVDGLAKMAAQAVSMRIDMKEVMNVVEKAFKPDEAIKMAASLQRLGVAQSELLDPLYLMNMAENDPTELQNQIVEMSKSFVKLNADGNFEIMKGSKRQLQEIAGALGISYGELSKMALASAEVEDKMKKISFPDDIFKDENQKKLFASVVEMGKGGEYKVVIEGQEYTMDKAMDKFREDNALLGKVIQDAQPKSMEDLAKEQLDVSKMIKTGIDNLKGVVPMAASGTEGGEAFLTQFAKFQKGALEMLKNEIVGTTPDLSKKIEFVLGGYAKDIKEALIPPKKFEDLGTNLTNLSDLLVKVFNDIKGAAGNITPPANLGITGTVGLQTLNTLIDKLSNVLSGSDVIIPSGDAPIVKTLPQDTIFAGTGLEFISDMIQNPKPDFSEGNQMAMTEVMKNIASTKTVTTTGTEGSKELKADFTFKFDLPPQVDAAMTKRIFEEELRKPNVIAGLISKINELETSYGQNRKA